MVGMSVFEPLHSLIILYLYMLAVAELATLSNFQESNLSRNTLSLNIVTFLFDLEGISA